MQTCAVCTHEYDIDVSKQLRKHMPNMNEIVDSGESYLVADTSNAENFDAFCGAVSELLTDELAYFALADIVSELPFEEEEKRIILMDSIRHSQSSTACRIVKKDLLKYFSNETSLVLESYMRFRMREAKRIWERCVDRATEELLLQDQQMELINLLGAFVRLTPPSVDKITVILNPDGSCQLTDDLDTHVDYPSDATDSALSLLVSLAPRTIIIYDLSNNECDELITTLCHVFEDRVKIYHAKKE